MSTKSGSASTMRGCTSTPTSCACRPLKFLMPATRAIIHGSSITVAIRTLKRKSGLLMERHVNLSMPVVQFVAELNIRS